MPENYNDYNPLPSDKCHDEIDDILNSHYLKNKRRISYSYPRASSEKFDDIYDKS